MLAPRSQRTLGEHWQYEAALVSVDTAAVDTAIIGTAGNIIVIITAAAASDIATPVSVL